MPYSATAIHLTENKSKQQIVHIPVVVVGFVFADGIILIVVLVSVDVLNPYLFQIVIDLDYTQLSNDVRPRFRELNAAGEDLLGYL
ncbi:hypothetical protein BpHYR1_009786 [Brachionus plicatilis]|uniref:Uncharacterized protein n=1 Tax=Brachionus plicatilis TaxID=10195 RepID=A0A3M7P196_BRAPC|nr:hypothetical protein BpHYR1_009786 [Brachionus plicatilis]